jgi:hypothetical protein
VEGRKFGRKKEGGKEGGRGSKEDSGFHFTGFLLTSAKYLKTVSTKYHLKLKFYLRYF